MITTMHPPLQLLQKAQAATTAGQRRDSAQGFPTAVRKGWLQRLASWAERQPPQHRLGSLDAYRHF